MDPDVIRTAANRIKADADLILAEVAVAPPPVVEPPIVVPPTVVKVAAGGNLQAALDKGGIIETEASATFERAGGFKITVPGTDLRAGSSIIIGTGYAAIDFAPRVHHCKVAIKEARSTGDQCVIQVADNVLRTVDELPHHITLTISVPTFRGKRAFYLNGYELDLIDCNALDVWDPAGRDSQGICILNTPGAIRIKGGKFEAGSENIMVGGAATAIAAIQPTGLTFEDVDLSKPLSWMGQPRKVKNNFELKSGVDVVLRNAKIDGCWTEAQSGSSIVLTPRDGKLVKNVLIEDVVQTNVGAGINLAGYDDLAVGPQTTGVTFRRVTCSSKWTNYGADRFAQFGGGARDITFDSCTSNSGGQCIYSFEGFTYVDGTTTKAKTYVTDNAQFLGNNFFTGYSYGFMAPGAYGQNWRVCFPNGKISGNTFHGSKWAEHKANLPADNIFKA